MTAKVLSDKAPGETLTIEWDFTCDLAGAGIGELLPSTATQANTDGRIQDYAPEDTVDGDPYFVDGFVYQVITGGLEFVDYKYVAKLRTDSTPVLTLEKASIVRVRAA